jgi:hypothetical protein
MINTETVEFIAGQDLGFVLGSAVMHIVEAAKQDGLDRDDQLMNAQRCIDIALRQNEPAPSAQPKRKYTRRTSPQLSKPAPLPTDSNGKTTKVCIICQSKKGLTAFPKDENTCHKCRRETEQKLNP